MGSIVIVDLSSLRKSVILLDFYMSFNVIENFCQGTDAYLLFDPSFDVRLPYEIVTSVFV